MSDRKGQSKPRVMPPVFFLTALLSIAVLHRWLPIATLIDAPFNTIGLTLIVFGFVAAIIPARAFGKQATAIRPFEESDVLITGGFYRISRNPMYLGMIIVLLGVAILLGTMVAFLPIPLFIMLIQRKFILAEERMLRERFGDRYIDYASSVRRWI